MDSTVSYLMWYIGRVNQLWRSFMKNWIRVIVALNSRLDALTEKIDEEVSLMSTSLYEPTMDLINDIKLCKRQV